MDRRSTNLLVWRPIVSPSESEGYPCPFPLCGRFRVSLPFSLSASTTRRNRAQDFSGFYHRYRWCFLAAAISNSPHHSGQLASHEDSVCVQTSRTTHYDLPLNPPSTPSEYIDRVGRRNWSTPRHPISLNRIDISRDGSSLTIAWAYGQEVWEDGYECRTEYQKMVRCALLRYPPR